MSDFNSFPIPLGPQQENDYAPFFLGQITRQKNKYVVRVTFTPGFGRAKKHILKEVPQGAENDQWVVGLEFKNRRSKFFGVNEQEMLEYPVQVITWDCISESNGQKSAVEYFCKSPKTTEINSDRPLIGKEKGNNGHVIIYDRERDVFLKGFFHVGGGKIQCSDVKFLSSKKFIDDVEQYNQATPMTSDSGGQFLLLVPKQKNEHEERGAHSVLDVGSWEELNAAKTQQPIEVRNSTGSMGPGNGRAGSPAANANSERVIGSDSQVPPPQLTPPVLPPFANKTVPDSAVGEKPGSEGEDPNMKYGQGYKDADKVAVDQAQEFNGAAPGKDSEPVVEEASAKNQSSPNDNFVGEPQSPRVIDTRPPEEREQEFLTNFKEYVKRCGFNYNDRDLERFHTCVKTGMMTLLGGDPGSGKSSLVALYARALAGESQECNCKCVDVNPTWMEPSDLMGYSTPNLNDPNGGKQFHESQCGLRRFLAGLKEPNKRAPALVCFEEMNLARIELYFAEFIQLISRYELTSGDKKLPSYGGRDKQEPLTIPSDIRFVGTCNDDPTVKPMSDRFLDRSNFIRLSGANKTWRGEDVEFHLFACGRGKIVPYSGDGVTAEEYSNWIQTQEDADQSRKEKNSLGNILDGILSKIQVKLSAIVACPSPRVIGEILRYVANRPFPSGVKDDNVRLYVAFDEALVQRVISKCVPNALMRGKFRAAANIVKETFEAGLKGSNNSVAEGQLAIASLTAERLEELEKETESLYRWSGVDDDGSVGDAE